MILLYEYKKGLSIILDKPFLVEITGLEPVTSTLPVSRSSQMS